MSKNPIVEFNNHLDDFFSFLIKICPNDIESKKVRADLVKYSRLLKTTLKMNKLKAIQSYIEFVLQYEDQINSREESFFLNLNYGEEMGGDNNSFLEALKFKDIWYKIEQDNREKIFDYMIVITYWCRMYFDSKV